MIQLLIILTFALVSAQPQLCAQGVQYSACQNTAALQIAKCSSQVKGPSNVALYSCLCDQNKAALLCYDLCKDDPQLQGQRESQQQTVYSACQFSAANPSNVTTSSSSVIVSSTAATASATQTIFSSNSITATLTSISLTVPQTSVSASVTIPLQSSTVVNRPPAVPTKAGGADSSSTILLTPKSTSAIVLSSAIAGTPGLFALLALIV